jgi:thiamine-monophosphate kinase
MRLADLGEAGLLDLVRDWTAGPRHGVVLGVGDDAAVLELPGHGAQVVVSTDTWHDEVHFSRRYLAPDEIGHRAMAGTLSDLAAMGAEGLAAFVSVSAPSDLKVKFLRGVYQGMDRVADSCGTAIAGGDTVRGELSLAITVVGSVPAGEAVCRDGARPGDILCVSGELGRSEAGRRLLSGEAEAGVPDRLRAVAEAGHRTPRPRFDVSRLLVGLERRIVDVDRRRETVERVPPSAMIDVSDGLAMDLRRLCVASGAGCRVEETRIPIDGAARRLARLAGEAEVTLALGGGEDYELLFAMPRGDVELLMAEAARRRVMVTPIGEVTTAAEGMRLVQEDGTERNLPDAGWDHFMPPDPPGSSPSHERRLRERPR